MTEVRVKVSEGGRVVIPAEFRRALGLEIGDEVLLRLEDGELRLITRRQAIKQAQKLVRHYIPEGRSLVDELIAERRNDATRE
jgi:AbrB family looped-hinge helix DNA binding protein